MMAKSLSFHHLSFERTYNSAEINETTPCHFEGNPETDEDFLPNLRDCEAPKIGLYKVSSELCV